MAQKCVHKGCGKVFSDPNEDCIYHPGPPVFHEGQKGWKCCKPRVLTFDEFMIIPPCTTGKHSTIDDTPKEERKVKEDVPISTPAPASERLPVPSRAPIAPQSRSASPAPPESESDDPDVKLDDGVTCRRRGCEASYRSGSDRSKETCIHHPGHAIFHEGSKGWSCCKRRVLEFDEFMKIEGCETKSRHRFSMGKKKPSESVEALQTVRNDFYQTPTSLIVSFYLKKINKEQAKVVFASDHILELDLPTTDNKHFKASIPLYGPIDTQKSSSKIMGTKLEMTLIKSDGSSWPVLRSDEKVTGEIFQVGKAGRA